MKIISLYPKQITATLLAMLIGLCCVNATYKYDHVKIAKCPNTEINGEYRLQRPNYYRHEIYEKYTLVYENRQWFIKEDSTIIYESAKNMWAGAPPSGTEMYATDGSPSCEIAKQKTRFVHATSYVRVDVFDKSGKKTVTPITGKYFLQRHILGTGQHYFRNEQNDFKIEYSKVHKQWFLHKNLSQMYYSDIRLGNMCNVAPPKGSMYPGGFNKVLPGISWSDEHLIASYPRITNVELDARDEVNDHEKVNKTKWEATEKKGRTSEENRCTKTQKHKSANKYQTWD